MQPLPHANGAKEYLTVGTVFQRALLVTTAIAAVLVLPLWLNVGWILTKFGALHDESIRVWLCTVPSLTT